jgi:hypothetical protein
LTYRVNQEFGWPGEIEPMKTFLFLWTSRETSQLKHLETVWYCVCNCVSSNFKFIFLLKLSAVCIFWIVLMCWCQKWFLKNKKTSLACISTRKTIWKAIATTLSNTHPTLIFNWKWKLNTSWETLQLSPETKEDIIYSLWLGGG